MNIACMAALTCCLGQMLQRGFMSADATRRGSKQDWHLNAAILQELFDSDRQVQLSHDQRKRIAFSLVYDLVTGLPYRITPVSSEASDVTTNIPAIAHNVTEMRWDKATKQMQVDKFMPTLARALQEHGPNLSGKMRELADILVPQVPALQEALS